MQKWEYKIIKFKPSQGIITKGFAPAEIEKKLNKIGDEEWELVNIFSTINPEYFWGGGKSSRTTEISCVFKRKKE